MVSTFLCCALRMHTEQQIALVCLAMLIGALLVVDTLPANIKAPNVLIEGCIDDGCLQSLAQHQRTIDKCFDPLRETIPAEDEEYSRKLCCNVVTYERCLFPFIISYCGMSSLDKFEAELRSLNALCSLTTLQWAKCEVNKTEPESNELELRE